MSSEQLSQPFRNLFIYKRCLAYILFAPSVLSQREYHFSSLNGYHSERTLSWCFNSGATFSQVLRFSCHNFVPEESEPKQKIREIVLFPYLSKCAGGSCGGGGTEEINRLSDFARHWVPHYYILIESYPLSDPEVYDLVLRRKQSVRTPYLTAGPP